MYRRDFLTLMAAWPLGLPAFAQDTVAWTADGTLLEACTCAVPCTCNFGQSPSPQHYCHTVYAYRLEKARWDDMDLSGLIIAGAEADKGSLGFLDSRATAEQRPNLEKLALAIFAKGGPSSGPRPFVTAKIVHDIKENDLNLTIAGYGGFTGRVLLGRDGKNPIVVENNTIWPIPRAIKGKTTKFTFRASNVGAIDITDTNANYGTFTLSSTE